MDRYIIEYCLKKKGAAKEYPFGPDPMVFKVAGKIFAIIFEEKDFINLKCDPVIAENLREQYEGVTPGYHMNKQHWNTVKPDASLPEDDIKAMIDHSYDLIVSKLPKSVRESIAEMKTKRK
ncbi:MmcQ/YjbR family DNA-binding protein [Paenibacillus pinihumi]|uniref:MmcQ/YjbR family DNA-binding protein n=1 Tax=Paenibacillus pinihumi TaxID=669462 RepID=UPI000420B0CE|nr:MmcQ/YjbR family DNA-binding protein [Paenibacillus pinihumi]